MFHEIEELRIPGSLNRLNPSILKTALPFSELNREGEIGFLNVCAVSAGSDDLFHLASARAFGVYADFFALYMAARMIMAPISSAMHIETKLTASSIFTEF